jgi:hypothetical protein
VSVGVNVAVMREEPTPTIVAVDPLKEITDEFADE